MIRRHVVLLSVAFLACSVGATTEKPPGPRMPTVVEQICVEDADGTLISMVMPYPFAPDKSNPEEFKAQLRNAINLAGRSNNRQDVIDAGADIQLVDNPLPPLYRKPVPRKNPNISTKAGCHTVCSCAHPIFCSQTGPGDPSTDAVRRAPSPPGGAVCGCSAGCGTCEKCVVVCN